MERKIEKDFKKSENNAYLKVGNNLKMKKQIQNRIKIKSEFKAGEIISKK